MADPAEPKRRVLKKAETVRELAENSESRSSQPKKSGVLRLSLRYIAVPFRFIGRPFAKLGRFKVFRIIGYILLPKYFRNSWKELRQVTWPSRRESWQLTSAVLLFAAVFGVLIALVDFGLDKLFKQVLLK
ncbi:MAG TPA: preprotein translocase subunit SecE [Candidatus Saccharimonadales bacterium]|nr:preprotein translocase subunit SecE [Candidatus Saccharimonadales bacterium]